MAETIEIDGNKVTQIGLTDTGGLNVLGRLFINGVEVFPSTTGVNPNEITVSQTAHGFTPGQWIYNNAGTYTLGIATSDAAANVVGVVIQVEDANTFTYQRGGFSQLTSWSLEGGFAPLDGSSQYYLSASVAGSITTTEPNSPNYSKGVLQADTTSIGNIRIDTGVVGPVP